MARKMKDSGIEWIGEIPEGWSIARGKHILTLLQRAVFPTDGIITCFRDGEVTLRSNRREDGFTVSLKEIGYQGIEPGDLVVHGMDGFAGSIGISDSRGKSSPVLVVLDSSQDKKYLMYYLRSMAYNNVFLALSTGIRVRSCDLKWNKLADLLYLVPPIVEQHKLVSFLDEKCSEIDAMLSKTRASIEEYKKLKQAVITQAVTKGVRGKREMKDSGVEWIGEIPVEWRKTQLRHCATIKSGITLGKSYSKDTVLIERPYLRVANVQGGYVDLNDLATIEVTLDEDLKYRLHSGDVLMTEGGDRDKLGRGCVWHGEIEPCLHQNHVFAVQTNETILLPEFLEYLTASDVGRSYFDVTAIKTTNLACTSSSKVLAFTIPLPSIEEQIEIVSFIKKRSLELNKLIMKKELLVQELESYKKSLIYEVVTGKREV